MSRIVISSSSSNYLHFRILSLDFTTEHEANHFWTTRFNFLTAALFAFFYSRVDILQNKLHYLRRSKALFILYSFFRSPTLVAATLSGVRLELDYFLKKKSNR